MLPKFMRSWKAKDVGIGALLSLFIFVGSFITGDSFLALAGYESALAQARGGDGVGIMGGPTGPGGQYRGTDLPSMQDAGNIGRMRSRAPEIGPDGRPTGMGCAMADADCNGVITNKERSEWAAKTVDDIRARCNTINCHYCKQNPADPACRPKPWYDFNLIGNFNSRDSYSNLLKQNPTFCMGLNCDEGSKLDTSGY